MTQTHILAVTVLISAIVMVLVVTDCLLSQPPEESEEPVDEGDTAPLRVGRWVR